jgi:hypothetical protein
MGHGVGLIAIVAMDILLPLCLSQLGGPLIAGKAWGMLDLVTVDVEDKVIVPHALEEGLQGNGVVAVARSGKDSVDRPALLIEDEALK